MFEWLMTHTGDILVLGVLAAVVGVIIFKMVRDKKAGKSHCGCGCEG
ncbi:MAG: FeoB-associated Cys-rich membrane protein, partial [Oscillospiraceae bacterium]|nr:FeoB-associated Cys-rich membrane protein [Oscillospiraceae bacterium]